MATPIKDAKKPLGRICGRGKFPWCYGGCGVAVTPIKPAKPRIKPKMTVREKEDRLVLIAEIASRRQPVNY